MFFLLIQVCSLLFVNVYGAIEFCTPTPPQSNPIAPPKLPDEFEARVEINVIDQKKTEFVHEFYDRYENKATLNFITKDGFLRLIADYTQDKLLVFSQDGKCSSFKLATSQFSAFFGIIFNGDGTELIGSPSQIFHIGTGYNSIYVGQTIRRGRPVNQWRSCQRDTATNSNYFIDLYFSPRDYNSSVIWDDSIKEVPVAAEVYGYSRINESTNTFYNFSHIYNFYEFRTFIEDKERAFNQPDAVYCAGLPLKASLPKLPKQFQYTEETIINGLPRISKIWYDYELKALRINSDDLGKRPPANTVDPVEVVHDFNSGVGYVINQNRFNCSLYSLGNNIFDLDVDTGYTVAQISQNLGFSIRMKDPEKFFYIDDSYYYAGEKVVRGILCDVFISNRTDYLIPGIGDGKYYSVFEWLFMKNTWSAQSSDQAEPVNPVALVIRIPQQNITIITNFYDFDTSAIPLRMFDVTQCYNGRQKQDFEIRYNYTRNLSEGEFNLVFKKLAEGFFLVPLTAALSPYNLSPLRVTAPVVTASLNGFSIRTGITDYPPPIYHYSKFGNVNINTNKTQFKIKAARPEDCAFICLNATQLVSDKFICYSFDFCKKDDNYLCTFYAATHITDPDLVNQNGDGTCDHFSKNVETFDSAPRDIALKEIRNAVSQGRFNISITTNMNDVLIDFPATSYREVTSFGSGGGGFDFGGGFENGFISEFKSFSIPCLFKDESISSNKSLFLRKRSDISVKDCARYCVTETAFECESFTYDYRTDECKWSSVTFDDETLNATISTNTYLITNPESLSALYIRDPIFNYIEFPFKVTADKDKKQIENVESRSKCARLCTKETSFSCRSFNYCPSVRGLCILSEDHVHNGDKNPNIVTSPTCTHFSKKNLNEFDLVPQTEITNPAPTSKIFNTQIEICASLCLYEDNYLCRSFSFYVDTGDCWFYKENLKDSVYFDISTKANENCNHYSRTVIVENGIRLPVDPQVNDKKAKKQYSGGAIAGIVLALVFGGLALGIMAGFVYNKKFKQAATAIQAQFKYQNPNFKNNNNDQSSE